MKISTVTLEMSLKPFRDPSPDGIDKVLKTLFEQWRPLYKDADSISILLWASDGSEILEYSGNLDDKFEWAKYIGCANPRWPEPDPNDPEGISIHRNPQPYIKNPPEFTYRWLKNLISKIKSYGKKVSGKPINLIATFDPGPEFAKSDFKYKRHNEICMANSMGARSFVCCYATMNADSKSYAGFPKGIPQGISLGTYLGRQSQRFMEDMGFDAIWLSNGFGFGLETWAYRGALFDGYKFTPEKAPETREKVLNFWRDFTKECKFPVQTRGSNFPSGTDLSSDAVPIREIYKKFKPQPPPNSPWAALNGDFGIEIGGWMSHIADLPDKSYIYRFYTHDPWFRNSPWLDRYNRESHDIYLPLAVSRIDENGKTTNPDRLSLLTVDNSYGEMPDQVPNEVIPHLLEAITHAPDAPSPVVWVYPFDEYHDMVAEGVRLDEMFFGDWFICGAINQGLPINTVISTTIFMKAIKKKPELFRESILVAPAAAISEKCADAIANFAKNGGRVILYGPVANACEGIRNLLNLKVDSPLEGEFKIKAEGVQDTFRTGTMPEVFVHNAIVSGGGIEIVLSKKDDSGTKIIAEASQGNQSRVIALSRSEKGWNGGRISWLRGTVSGTASSGGHLLKPMDPGKNFYTEILPRIMLHDFGYDISYSKYSWGGRDPITMIARHSNGFYFSGFVPDITAGMKLRMPQGIPLFTGTETIIENGRSSYNMPKSWHKECRIFIEQDEDGRVACAENTAEYHGLKRRIKLSGLKNATVRFYHEPGTEKKVQMLLDPVAPFLIGKFQKFEITDDSNGRHLDLKNITGELMISW
ncbi:MAG TPA: hypothetical protein DCZ94_19305 [Lentisphaeria bacterium]|nr:MAG: hypothetical protein A2X48_01550 [Lentisphaerae bacterium GWF2_49_21]HBC89092.1 hypothetical protein [Lentisphaeria bacterium]